MTQCVIKDVGNVERQLHSRSSTCGQSFPTTIRWTVMTAQDTETPTNDRTSNDRTDFDLRDLPDDITLSEAIDHLVYLRKLEIGMSQMESGKTIAAEQVRLRGIGEAQTKAASEATVASLYADGRLSGREARTLLEISRRDFEEMLSRHGVSVLIDTDENVRIELDQGDG